MVTAELRFLCFLGLSYFRFDELRIHEAIPFGFKLGQQGIEGLYGPRKLMHQNVAARVKLFQHIADYGIGFVFIFAFPIERTVGPGHEQQVMIQGNFLYSISAGAERRTEKLRFRSGRFLNDLLHIPDLFLHCLFGFFFQVDMIPGMIPNDLTAVMDQLQQLWMRLCTVSINEGTETGSTRPP